MHPETSHFLRTLFLPKAWILRAGSILFHEKLEKLTFHMKLASIFSSQLRGTNPPMGCITTSLVTVTFSVQIEDASLANAMSMTLLTTHFSFI